MPELVSEPVEFNHRPRLDVDDATAPLRCRLRNNLVVITIGIDTLADIATWHESFRTMCGPAFNVTDKKVFAEEVVIALNDSRRGVKSMFNDAIVRAVDDGADGCEIWNGTEMVDANRTSDE